MAVGGVKMGETARAMQPELEDEARAARRAVLEGLEGSDVAALATAAPVGLFASVPNHGIVLVNDRYCDVVGCAREDLLGHAWRASVHPDDIAEVEAARVLAIDGGEAFDRVYRIVRPDDEVRWVRVRAQPVHNGGGAALVIGSVVDLTEFKRVEAALRESEARVRDQASILEMIATSTPLTETLIEICLMVESQLPGIRCTVLLADAELGTLRHGAAPSLSASFTRAIDGLAIKEGSGVCGTAAARGVSVVVDDVLTSPLTAEYLEQARDEGIGACWSTPVCSSSDDRVLGTFAIYTAEEHWPTANEESVVESVVQLAAIAIERNEFEDRLAHQAHHDPLTGLPNRTLFGELLEHALRRAQRSGSGVGVLFLDLDRFKVVNDSLGHDAGDELLVALARRLSAVLRPGDIVARFGGDEFTVLCEDLVADTADRQTIGVAERLIDAMREPFVVDGDEQFVSASIGIAIGLTGLERPDELLRDADAAMYRAKELGKGRCEVFDQDMRDHARERLEIENALHRAVARREFRVFYQPVISLLDGACLGVEALARWQHPERGLLAPQDFLDQAEETGLVVPIGGLILEEACARGAEWSRAISGREPFRLSVNLSGRQLIHADLAALVAGILERTALDPNALCVEITETVLMEDVDAGVSAVKELKGLGVRVSIDDFGTGYSALNYLRQFPVDEVKIDRSFVQRLGSDQEDAAIVAAVVSLGHALGVTVTGEGVETTSQLETLRMLGVDAAQGFLFAPPQPAQDLTPLLVRPHSWG